MQRGVDEWLATVWPTLGVAAPTVGEKSTTPQSPTTI